MSRLLNCLCFAATLICLSAPPARLVAQEPAIIAELTPQTWNQLIPSGKEVDAIYGDMVLQNSRLRAVIARPAAGRNANMTVRDVGGCLIDLVARSQESDALSAFYPGRKKPMFSAWKAASGDRDGAATVTVTAPGADSPLSHTVEWRLGADSAYLTATSTWKNTSAADLTLVPEDELRQDGGKEDMQKSAEGLQELFWFHDVFWQQAYGISAAGFRVRVKTNARESVLTWERLDGQPVVLRPGEEFVLKRSIFVNQDYAGVLADSETASGSGGSLQPRVLAVTAGGQPVAGARLQLKVAGRSRGTVVTNADGLSSVRLPSGDPDIQVTIAGQAYASTLSAGKINDQPATLIAVGDYHPGFVDLKIVDGDQQPIPAKVEFIGRTGTPTPNWGPDTGDFLVRNLAYTANGRVQLPIQSGEYDLIVSHGAEFHAEFTTLKVEPGKSTERTISLPRLVSTPGWISADFHSHSSPSGDNTSSQLGRVLNLAAEHIEFAPCTEHNRVSSYDMHIQRLQLQNFLATVSGMELTGSPLPLNHQNTFPMILRERTQDGGGPQTDLSPETQMERLAAWDNNSVKLIQQNHPDVGWLFYDRDGNQTPDGGFERSLGIMNVMEIHPIDKLMKFERWDIRGGKPAENHTAFNWLQLLNQGFRIYGVVNTDSHYNFHGSGGLRIWVKSSTDEPGKIKADEIRDASREGRIVMSNGPWLEAAFVADGGSGQEVTAGEDLEAKSGKIRGKIRVQCSDFFDIDTAMVLVNGRPGPELTFTRQTHPHLFHADTVRFEHTVEIQLEQDAHLVVLAGHSVQKLGPVFGPDWGAQHPAAVTNPVFVDVDGGGFKANRDTLGHPLPVKFLAP
ncbi:MAG: CehA/McbA family metallohydrolase [Planctomycetota bacterium]